jgi:hypothetical protein
MVTDLRNPWSLERRGQSLLAAIRRENRAISPPLPSETDGLANFHRVIADCKSVKICSGELPFSTA